jgi:hypothetical protein
MVGSHLPSLSPVAILSPVVSRGPSERHKHKVGEAHAQRCYYEHKGQDDLEHDVAHCRHPCDEEDGAADGPASYTMPITKLYRAAKRI